MSRGIRYEEVIPPYKCSGSHDPAYPPAECPECRAWVERHYPGFTVEDVSTPIDPPLPMKNGGLLSIRRWHVLKTADGRAIEGATNAEGVIASVAYQLHRWPTPEPLGICDTQEDGNLSPHIKGPTCVNWHPSEPAPERVGLTVSLSKHLAQSLNDPKPTYYYLATEADSLIQSLRSEVDEVEQDLTEITNNYIVSREQIVRLESEAHSLRERVEELEPAINQARKLLTIASEGRDYAGWYKECKQWLKENEL